MTNVNPVQSVKKRMPHLAFEAVTIWVGSVTSLFVHTLVFIGCFTAAFLHIVEWETMLLVLTTLVSLEAIYLSIFIQMTVNRHQRELEEVSEDIEDIQEDVEDISEDVEDLGKDVEDIQENIEEITEEEQAGEAQKSKELTGIEQLTKDIRRVLDDLESFKKEQK